VRRAFRERIRRAIANPVLQEALDNNADRRIDAFHNALRTLPDPDALRDRARQIRQDTIEHLDHYHARFIEQVQQNGIQIHFAKDAAEACRCVIDIAQDAGADLIVKSKTMVSEEIELNRALEAVGIRAVESDLGEFIVQLRDEPPAHIITPAIHLLRQDVARTFEQKLGMPFSTDVADMNVAARRHLRDLFLQTPIGLTGVNFGVADTGTLCLVTNEGNGRMVTTIAPIHIALMGIERLVPTLDDLAVMLQLLSRFATGQELTSYISLIQGPRQPEDASGPEQRHLILVDNGRTTLQESNLSESLLCIRCGACLNACPVYREVGGHAYDSVYPGPIGSLVSPGLFGIKSYGHLSKASTLCGACVEACPVSIDFPTLLLRVRDHYTQSAPQPWWLRVGLSAFSWLATSPKLYRLAQRVAGFGSNVLTRRENWFARFPPPLNAWTDSRHFPPFAAKPFLGQAKIRPVQTTVNPARRQAPEPSPPDESEPQSMDLLELMRTKLIEVDGEWISCHISEVSDHLTALLQDAGVEESLIWGELDPPLLDVQEQLTALGYHLVEPHIPHMSSTARLRTLESLGNVSVGITGVLSGLADTGTLVLPCGGRQSGLVSLLPETHIALLNEKDVYPSLRSWLREGGQDALIQAQQTVLVTGPSRTADIEMTLTLGVHGPGRVVVICYREP
jgi:L-lactate dehydrogenase complex protein LldF